MNEKQTQLELNTLSRVAIKKKKRNQKEYYNYLK